MLYVLSRFAGEGFNATTFTEKQLTAALTAKDKIWDGKLIVTSILTELLFKVLPEGYTILFIIDGVRVMPQLEERQITVQTYTLERYSS